MLAPLIQLLLSDVQVTAIVGQRVYAQVADQTGLTPYLTCTIVSGVPERCRNQIAYESTRVQINAIGKTYKQAADLYQAVRHALDGAHQNGVHYSWLSVTDLTRDNGSAYGKAIDFQLITD